MFEKKCSKCGEIKDKFTDFPKDGRSKYTQEQLYKSRCKPCYRADKKEEYYSNHEENKRIARKKMAKHAHKHAEKRREYSRKRQVTHGDHIRKLDRDRYAKDPSKKKEAVRRYISKFPEKKRVFQERRRARKRAASGDCTQKQWQDRLEYYGSKCVYCGSEEDITMEHRIPLSRGGTHWPANLVPACHNCNCSKHTKTETEYKQLLASREQN